MDQNNQTAVLGLLHEAGELIETTKRIIGENRPMTPPRMDDSQLNLCGRAKERLRFRRNREKVFAGYDLFADPAWDILLDLYVAHCEETSISVSSACIGAACPSTTALRHLRALTVDGMISKESDVADGRRFFVTLTERAVKLMEAVLSS